ncbi:hypothetical protein N1851_012107 [Merluccius polli]|uniref:Reverse transcriptase n=1 Tax=Merluccius polli TaxID=89951 RepID=A0AA47P5C0_MERPO|nr:hypothetical protein N1851_012107 [Merluccius polli]
MLAGDGHNTVTQTNPTMATKNSRGRIPPESARAGVQDDSPTDHTITSEKGLKIHHGRKKCLKELTKGPRIDHYFLRGGLKGGVERKLEKIGDIIYSYGTERFGVKCKNLSTQKEPSAHLKSRRQQEIERLVKERRCLRKQWKKATEVEWEAIEALQGDIKQRLATLRIAECLRRQYKKKERTRTAFYRDPYKFVKNLFVKEKTGTLKAPVRELEEHLRKTYSDNRRHVPTTIPDDTPPIQPPEYQLDTRPPTWSEVENTVKRARTASAPRPNGVPYRLYKNTPDLKDSEQVEQLRQDTISGLKQINTTALLAWLRPPTYFRSNFISLQYWSGDATMLERFLFPKICGPISEQEARPENSDVEVVREFQLLSVRKLKLWCFQFGLLPRLMWPVSIYEVTLSHAKRLERLRCCSHLSHREEVKAKCSSGTGKVRSETPGHRATTPTWQKATPAERRRLVVEEVRHQEEADRSARAVSQAKQGRWMRWDGVERRKITWSELWNMESNMLSFTIRATYDVLPTPANLHLWLGEDPACLQCLAPATLKHILVGCKTSLTQGRYTWRHNQVLKPRLPSDNQHPSSGKGRNSQPTGRLQTHAH